VARVLPELVGKGKNDSFQRGLVSSSETVWNNPVMGDTLDKLLGGSDPDICAFLEMLDARLGHGIDHPKVKATTDWVVSQVHEGHHVIVFTVWKQTQKTLHETLAKRLGDDTVTGPVKGTIPDVFQKRVSEPPDGSPVVLVLTDRFSESIDLDGGCPSLVHHDLSWNPVRVTQRWGRVVRVRTVKGASTRFRKNGLLLTRQRVDVSLRSPSPEHCSAGSCTALLRDAHSSLLPKEDQAAMLYS
jgi:hypothetical protein